MLRGSLLFSRKNIGVTAGLGQHLFRKELVRYKKSGSIKTLKKDRWLYCDLGYYYQSGIYHNWFITASYTLRRMRSKGYYFEFSPFLGLSRTFLTEETYTISENGTVKLKKFNGNWYINGGFGYGFGKTFKEGKNSLLKSVYLNIYTQLLYPNFRFIAIRPFWQIGTSFNLHKVSQLTRKIILKK